MPDELKPTRMTDDEQAKPVIEDARRKEMKPVRPRRIGGKILRMAADVPDAPVSATSGDRMKAAPSKITEEEQPKERGEQEPPKTPPIVTVTEGGYVRVRFRVENGEITVVGANAVEGPFVADERVTGETVYEVMRDRKRLATGTILETGEWRSFPHPEGKGVMAGHHVTQEESYEFSARVPKAEFSEAALPRMRVSVFRVKRALPDQPLTAAPLVAQFSDELREVARLQGIRLDQLADDVREQVRRAAK